MKDLGSIILVVLLCTGSFVGWMLDDDVVNSGKVVSVEHGLDYDEVCLRFSDCYNVESAYTTKPGDEVGIISGDDGFYEVRAVKVVDDSIDDASYINDIDTGTEYVGTDGIPSDYSFLLWLGDGK